MPTKSNDAVVCETALQNARRLAFYHRLSPHSNWDGEHCSPEWPRVFGKAHQVPLCSSPFLTAVTNLEHLKTLKPKGIHLS